MSERSERMKVASDALLDFRPLKCGEKMLDEDWFWYWPESRWIQVGPCEWLRGRRKPINDVVMRKSNDLSEGSNEG